MKKIIFVLTALFLLLCSGCTKNVSDHDLSVTFQEQDITGKYTGQLIDNVATSDNATFTYKNGDDYLNYTGPFKDGKFIGNGTLETNFLTVHFNDSDRVGEYKGDVVDGIPKGNGSFTATNDEDETYTYTGEWDNGIFNGYGERFLENIKSIKAAGTWVNGEFTPTKVEYLKFLGQDIPDDETDTPFTMSDETVEFIESHDSIFPTDNFESIKNLVDTSIEFKHLMKNINNYSQKLIKYDKGYVLSINENNSYGREASIIQVGDLYGTEFYYIYYFGKLDDIFKGDTVLIYGLPLGTTHFTNLGNTTTQGIVMLGSYFVKQ